MSSGKEDLGFGTRVIHGGQKPDPLTGAVMPPIYATSTYVQSSPGVHKGYEYSRTANPTRDALQASVANLEGGAAGFAFASGLAASATIVDLLDSGSHIIAMHDLYGGSYRLFENVRKRSAGHEVSFVDLTDPAALEAAIRPNTRMIWVETPTNPLLKIVDLRAVAAVAKKRGILSVCDNTFATPYLQRPLEHGFDLVVHSTTKYLNGHSDAIGGAAVIRHGADELRRSSRICRMRWAACRGRSIPSSRCAGSRRSRCAWSGTAVTRSPSRSFSSRIRRWRASFIPGCRAIRITRLARRQMQGGFGGIVTVELRGGIEDARRFLERCHLFALAESLGGVESLIEHPALMTHASLPAAMRAQLGISDSLVRLSVGVESVDDLIAELRTALA